MTPKNTITPNNSETHNNSKTHNNSESGIIVGIIALERSDFLSRHGRVDVWVKARGWESVWRATVPSFGVAIQTMKNKYI